MSFSLKHRYDVALKPPELINFLWQQQSHFTSLTPKTSHQFCQLTQIIDLIIRSINLHFHHPPIITTQNSPILLVPTHKSTDASHLPFRRSRNVASLLDASAQIRGLYKTRVNSLASRFCSYIKPITLFTSIYEFNAKLTPHRAVLWPTNTHTQTRKLFVAAWLHSLLVLCWLDLTSTANTMGFCSASQPYEYLCLCKNLCLLMYVCVWLYVLVMLATQNFSTQSLQHIWAQKQQRSIYVGT